VVSSPANLPESERATVLRPTFHERRNRTGRHRLVLVRQAFVLLACLTAAAYFAYHARYGRHGMEARALLLERSALLNFETQSLETVRAKLERDVALLSPELPNADLVEEVARDVLGYVHPADRIIAVH
jgi:cell division protein FtsB